MKTMKTKWTKAGTMFLAAAAVLSSCSNEEVIPGGETPVGERDAVKTRICDNILKSGDMGNHLFNLCALISAALEILTHPVFQTDGFSNIDDLVLLPMHNINPRLTRKFFQFFFNVK